MKTIAYKRAVKIVGEPYRGKPDVRFDEGVQGISLVTYNDGELQRLHEDSTLLYVLNRWRIIVISRGEIHCGTNKFTTPKEYLEWWKKK